MPDRGDISEFFDGTLTYRNVVSKTHPDGRTYVVPEPDAKTGLWLSSMGDSAVQSGSGIAISKEAMARLKLDDDQERSLYQIVLGPAYDEMLADEVPWPKLKGIATDAFLYHAVSQELADFVRGLTLGEAAARPDRADPSKKPNSTGTTRQKKGGSASKKASTATRARTRKPGSIRSSTPTLAGGNAGPAPAV